MVLALEALFLQACTDLRVVRREMYAVIVQCIKNEILVEPERGALNGIRATGFMCRLLRQNYLMSTRIPSRLRSFGMATA